MNTKLVDFDILLNEAFVNICLDTAICPIDKSSLLSVVNGFEDGKWRMNVFRNFVFNNLAETGLSAREREALADIRHTAVTNSKNSVLRIAFIDQLTGVVGKE